MQLMAQKQPDQQPLFEGFVSAEVAAKFLGISRPFLLSLARQGMAGAYPLGTGSQQRHVWVFRLSELSSSMDRRRYDSTRRFPLK